MQKIFYNQSQASRNQASLLYVYFSLHFHSELISFSLNEAHLHMPVLPSGLLRGVDVARYLLPFNRKTRKPSIYNTEGTDPTLNFYSFYKHLDPFSTIFHILFRKRLVSFSFFAKLSYFNFGSVVMSTAVL